MGQEDGGIDRSSRACLRIHCRNRDDFALCQGHVLAEPCHEVPVAVARAGPVGTGLGHAHKLVVLSPVEHSLPGEPLHHSGGQLAMAPKCQQCTCQSTVLLLLAPFFKGGPQPFPSFYVQLPSTNSFHTLCHVPLQKGLAPCKRGGEISKLLLRPERLRPNARFPWSN